MVLRGMCCVSREKEEPLRSQGVDFSIARAKTHPGDRYVPPAGAAPWGGPQPCCAVREKEPPSQPVGVDEKPLFCQTEVELDLDRALFLSFTPMWHPSEGQPAKRRLAVANERKLHVYQARDTRASLATAGMGAAAGLDLVLEYCMEVDSDLAITGIMFGERGDESESRSSYVAKDDKHKQSPKSSTVVVAAEPLRHAAGPRFVRIWRCDRRSELAFEKTQVPTMWTWQSGYTVSLDGHVARIFKLELSSHYLFTIDVAGWCQVWDKNKTYSRRTRRQLDPEPDGIADVTTDRHFLYCAGRRDLSVKVWSVPDLQLVMRVSAQWEPPSSVGQPTEPPSPSSPPRLPHSLASPPQSPPASCVIEPLAVRLEGAAAAFPLGSLQLVELVHIQRPMSRWSGVQASEKVRNGAPPKGMLFVSGIVVDTTSKSPARSTASVLMVWSLGKTPTCHSMEIVHDAPLVATSYGPYDNGPVVTADRSGITKVWDFSPSLTCVQELDIALVASCGCSPAIVSDPPYSSMYAVVGDDRLIIWRRPFHVVRAEEFRYGDPQG